MDRRMMLGTGAVLLAVGAGLLLFYRDINTMDPWYLALLVIGTVIVSFTVGYVLGYVTEDGTVPGSDSRE
jgi:hypothetical protein